MSRRHSVVSRKRAADTLDRIAALTDANVAEFGTVDERADAVLAYLRAVGGFISTAAIKSAHGYSNGMLGGVMAKLLQRGDVERRGRTWRARNPSEQQRRI